MSALIAATGAGAWLLLVGAAITGLAFGMLLRTFIGGGKKK